MRLANRVLLTYTSHLECFSMEILLDELKLVLLGLPFFKNHSRTELASEPHYVLKDNKYTFFYKNSKI